MGILPIAGAGQLLAAGAAVAPAVSSASAVFAGLLKGMLTPARPGGAPEGLAPPATPIEFRPGEALAAKLAELRGRQSSALETFHRLLRRVFEQQAVDPPGELRLEVGGSGQLRVVGEPEDRAAIESALFSAPELKSLAESIRNLTQLLGAVEGVHRTGELPGDDAFPFVIRDTPAGAFIEAE